VLTRTRAARLARRAAGRRRDGSRRLLARPAWNRLVRAGDAGDVEAIAAVWLGWLKNPDDQGWELLARWRGLANVTEDACDEVLDDDGAFADAVGAFCARRVLAPADPARRAAFFLLTGQASQLRALDPDGALLALAYAGAGGLRERLRAAMAAAGDLDLIRAVALGDPRRRTAELMADEAAYLTAQLAHRRNWAGLWSLARDLPLAEAVTAMRHFEAGWRPAGEADLALFGLLARADHGRIAGSARALAAHSTDRIEVPGKPTVVSFSPDGRRVAIGTHDARHRAIISVFELADGTLSERYGPNGSVPICLLDLGDALVAAESVLGIWRDPSPPPALTWYAAGRAQVLRLGGESASRRHVWLAAHPAGFVALDCPSSPGVGEDAGLLFYTSDGQLVRRVSLSGHLGLPARLRAPRRVATDRDGRLLALAGRELWLLDGEASRVIATRPLQQGRFTSVCFPGTDVVATADTDGYVRSYRARDGLELLAEELFGTTITIAALGGGEIAIGGAGVGQAEFRDADTLAPIGTTTGLPFAREVWGSPGDRYFAAAGTRRVDLGQGRRSSTVTVNIVSIVPGRHTAAMEALAGRPMAAMTPADLAAVTAETGHSPQNSATWPFLDLLRACLEHRFAADVAVGPVGPVADGGVEIAISADEDPPC
jgi:hypothetical protein